MTAMSLHNCLTDDIPYICSSSPAHLSPGSYLGNRVLYFFPVPDPLLQVWAAKADVVATSLLPKVVSELGRRIQQAVQQYVPGTSPSPFSAPPSGTLLFPNHDFQVGRENVTELVQLRSLALVPRHV